MAISSNGLPCSKWHGHKTVIGRASRGRNTAQEEIVESGPVNEWPEEDGDKYQEGTPQGKCPSQEKKKKVPGRPRNWTNE